jgi:hypothetical protein
MAAPTSTPTPVQVVILHAPGRPWWDVVLLSVVVPVVTTFIAAGLAYLVARWTVNRQREIDEAAATESHRIERETRLADARVRRSHKAAYRLTLAFGEALPPVVNYLPGGKLDIGDLLWQAAVHSPDITDLVVMTRTGMITDFFLAHVDWMEALPDPATLTTQQWEPIGEEALARGLELAAWVKWILVTLAAHRNGQDLPNVPDFGRHYSPEHAVVPLIE